MVRITGGLVHASCHAGARGTRGLLAQAVLPHLGVEEPPVDAQFVCGAGPIASSPLECLEDQPPLERRDPLLEGAARLSALGSHAVAVSLACLPGRQRL